MGARRRGGGGRVGGRPSLEIQDFFFAIWGAFVLLSFHMVVFLLRFSYDWAFFTIWGSFRYFFFHVGTFFVFMGAFFRLAPPPLPKDLRASMYTDQCPGATWESGGGGGGTLSTFNVY